MKTLLLLILLIGCGQSVTDSSDSKTTSKYVESFSIAKKGTKKTAFDFPMGGHWLGWVHIHFDDSAWGKLKFSSYSLARDSITIYHDFFNYDKSVKTGFIIN